MVEGDYSGAALLRRRLWGYRSRIGKLVRNDDIRFQSYVLEYINGTNRLRVFFCLRFAGVVPKRSLKRSKRGGVRLPLKKERRGRYSKISQQPNQPTTNTQIWVLTHSQTLENLLSLYRYPLLTALTTTPGVNFEVKKEGVLRGRGDLYTPGTIFEGSKKNKLLRKRDMRDGRTGGQNWGRDGGERRALRTVPNSTCALFNLL